MSDSPLFFACVTSASLAASVLGWTIVRTPARVAPHLGSRGLKRRRAVATGEWFPIFEPLVRWLGSRLSGLLPESTCSALDRRLVRTGDWLGVTAEEYVVLVVLGAAVGLGAGAVHAHFFEAYACASYAVGGALGAFFACSRFDARIAKRAREITHGLPYVTDLLALAMTAGLDFPGAVRNVLERSSDPEDALTGELERVLQELSLGHTRRYALEQLAERAQVPAATELVYAVVQAEERGSSLADVLAIQAQVLRQKRTAIAEEITSRAQQLMMLPLMLLTGATMIIVIVPMMLRVLDTFERLS